MNRSLSSFRSWIKRVFRRPVPMSEAKVTVTYSDDFAAIPTTKAKARTTLQPTISPRTNSGG